MRAISAALILSFALSGTAFANNVCLQATKIDHTRAPSDDVLLVYMNDGKIWQNKLKATCQGLKFENGVKWEIRGGTICSNMQSFRVLRQSNFCFLGEFTPYTPPAKAS